MNRYNKAGITSLSDADLIEEYKWHLKIDPDELTSFEIEYGNNLKAEIDRRGLKHTQES